MAQTMHAGVSPQGRRRAASVLPAELQRFRQVIGSHNIGTFQIGDRPGDAQQAIETARGQRDFFEGTFEQAAPCLVEFDVGAQRPAL